MHRIRSLARSSLARLAAAAATFACSGGSGGHGGGSRWDFGSVQPNHAHASPSKIAVDTLPGTEGPCPPGY